MATYKQNRDKGSFVTGGRTITRQAPLTRILIGNLARVVFSLDHDVRGNYAIIDAKDLQPSHIGSAQNPLHFIPEAQPRNRSTSASGALTPEKIAQNLRPDELLYGSTAYSGPPVVNARGEVIQGNGRAMAIKTYYSQSNDDPRGYRQAIEDGNARFGFLLVDAFPKTLAKMGIANPVLVRLLAVSDREAIELGQFTQADTEAVATSTTRIKSKARLLTKSVLKRVLNELARTDTDDKTLAELIRESRVLQVLIKEEIIRPDDLENYTKNGTINEEGVNFVSSLLLNATFRNADVNTADIFTGLPAHTQTAIKKSTLFLLRCVGPKSLNAEVSESILAYREFMVSLERSVGSWKNQYDLSGQTAGDRYSPLALALADLYQQSTTQKQVVVKFREYSTLVNGSAGDMFTAASKGATKREAVKAVFKAKFTPDAAITAAKRTGKVTLKTAKKRGGTPRRAAQTSAGSMPKPKPNIAKLLTGRKAAQTVQRIKDRAPVKPRVKKEVAELVGFNRASSTNSDSQMALSAKEKTALVNRLAEGRALAKKKKGAGRKTTTQKKAAASAKAATKPKVAATPKKATPKAKPATKKTAAVGGKPKARKRVKSAGQKEGVSKRVAIVKKTARVPSKKQIDGLKYIEERDRIADEIHQKSATGQFVKVPVYRVSISESRKRAEAALARSKKTGNVKNIRLKV